MTDTEHPPAVIAEERDAFSSLALVAQPDTVRIELEFDRDWEPPHSLDIPWPVVLTHAPREAIIAALMERQGIETRVLGPHTTLMAEFVTFTKWRMSHEKDDFKGPCTVIIVKPETSP